jgi:hypothetical protein
VAIDKTKTIYGQTKQICFESFTAVLVSFSYSPCAIPKTSNLLLSTNGRGLGEQRAVSAERVEHAVDVVLDVVEVERDA